MEIGRTVVTALEEKKGEDIILLDIHEISSFADYFVICSGTSNRMLDTLVEAVMESVKKTHGIIGKPEGIASGGWVVLDLGDVVVHVFSPDQREYYQLEQLWERGKVLVHLQ